MDELYIDNLDEYIQDEGLLVTYKWLSLTLNVPCNTAKQMLFHYVNKQRNTDERVKLNVTYLISGVKYDEDLKQDIHKVCVVCESNLNEIKETFKRIFSIHFYSVQKARLHDLNVLYIADYDKVKENVYETSKYSGINCPSIQIRSSDEINTLNSKSAYKSSSPIKSNVGKAKSLLETKQKGIYIENKENKFNGLGVNKEIVLKNNINNKKNVSKGGIASMFANQTKKMEEKALESVISSTTKIHPGEEKRSKKGTLSNFFTKGLIVKPQNQEIKAEERLDVTKKTEDSVKTEVKSEDSDILLDEEESPLAKSPIKPKSIIVESKECVYLEVNSKFHDNKDVKIVPKCSVKRDEKVSLNKPKMSSTNSKGHKSINGKRKSNKEDRLSDNKRRRILAMESSSESSSEEIEEVDEDPMPAPVSSAIESDDDDEVIPPTPQDNSIDVAELAKMKKRKLVNKTFMDEDGFLVTKKEYEFQSDCSDEESPIPSTKKVIKSPKKQILSPKKKVKSPKKKVKSPRKNKKKSPVKQKQASITSFFKRN